MLKVDHCDLVGISLLVGGFWGLVGRFFGLVGHFEEVVGHFFVGWRLSEIGWTPFWVRWRLRGVCWKPPCWLDAYGDWLETPMIQGYTICIYRQTKRNPLKSRNRLKGIPAVLRCFIWCMDYEFNLQAN